MCAAQTHPRHRPVAALFQQFGPLHLHTPCYKPCHDRSTAELGGYLHTKVPECTAILNMSVMHRSPVWPPQLHIGYSCLCARGCSACAETKGRVTGASGATTTVALVHPQRAVFASLGDSLAVLCRCDSSHSCSQAQPHITRTCQCSTSWLEHCRPLMSTSHGVSPTCGIGIDSRSSALAGRASGFHFVPHCNRVAVLIIRCSLVTCLLVPVLQPACVAETVSHLS